MNVRLSLIVACVGSLLEVKSAYATCSAIGKEFIKGTLLERIIAFGDCIKKEQSDRIGKYICHIERMVGIQRNEDGTIFDGKIKPLTENFTVTIVELSDAEKRIQCDLGDYGIRYNYGSLPNYCLANYVLRLQKGIDTAESLSIGFDSNSFSNQYSTFRMLVGDMFVLTDTLENAYVATGKCEKLN